MCHTHTCFTMTRSLADDMTDFNHELNAYSRRYDDLVTEHEINYHIGGFIGTALIGSAALYGNLIAKAIKHQSARTIFKQSAATIGYSG